MKKIFIVFMVILLLGLSIVPSFADSDSDSSTYVYAIIGYSYYVDGVVCNFGNGSHSFDTDIVISRYNFDNCYIFINGSYYGYYDLSLGSVSLSLSSGDVVTLSPYGSSVVSFITVLGPDSVTLISDGYTYEFENLDTYYLAFRASCSFFIENGYYNYNDTLIYSDGQTNYYDGTVSEYVFYKPSTLYTSYTSFVGNLWHSFEWLGYLTSTFSGLFIFIGGVLAALIVVFLFVFFFKRFGGV